MSSRDSAGDDLMVPVVVPAVMGERASVNDLSDEIAGLTIERRRLPVCPLSVNHFSPVTPHALFMEGESQRRERLVLVAAAGRQYVSSHLDLGSPPPRFWRDGGHRNAAPEQPTLGV